MNSLQLNKWYVQERKPMTTKKELEQVVVDLKNEIYTLKGNIEKEKEKVVDVNKSKQCYMDDVRVHQAKIDMLHTMMDGIDGVMPREAKGEYGCDRVDIVVRFVSMITVLLQK